MAKVNRVVSVIGLGYVGLPVAVAFGKMRKTVGFDINAVRITEIKNALLTKKEKAALLATLRNKFDKSALSERYSLSRAEVLGTDDVLKGEKSR